MRLLKSLWNYRLLLLILLIASVRFVHFDNVIDTPHSWRQYDTKQYIDAYYSGETEFLKPAVCWMGGHKTLLLEFPLPEYIVAQLYKGTGPEVWVARLFFLACFLGMLVYLYKTLRLLFSNYVPEIALAIVGLAPLSIYYSRAVHIDFFVLLFSVAMTYYCMKSIRERKMKFLIIGMLCAVIAFLVKSPYAFYFAIPIGMFAVTEKAFKWLLPRAIIFIVPLLALCWWVQYSKALNATVPDWSFIPGFKNFTDMWYWYFGDLSQRFFLRGWVVLKDRVLWEVTGVFGAVVFSVGLLFYKNKKTDKAYLWACSLLFATAVYAVIFFPVNVIHNYYQLPFVLCCGVIIAMGIQTIANWIAVPKIRAIVLVIMIGLFGAESIRYAESNYYVREDFIQKVAEELQKNTAEDDLVIISYGGLSGQCPLILQPAGRYGWSIPVQLLTPEIAYKLWETGKATKLAVVYGGYFEGEFRYFFEAMENKQGIPLNDEGYVLYLCDLKF